MKISRVCPYMVGDVYITSAATDPNDVWPMTTWQRVQDVMLMAAGPVHPAGSTGGAESVALTVDQLPSHTHTVGAHAHGLNGHTHSFSGSASHKHTPSNGDYGFMCHPWSAAALTRQNCASGSDRTLCVRSEAAITRYNTSTETVTISGTTGGCSTSTAKSSAFASGAAGGGGLPCPRSRRSGRSTCGSARPSARGLRKAA